MNPTGKALTAIERARLAYDLMMHRQRELIVRRRALERSRTITVVVVCAGMLALIVTTAIHYNWLPTSLRSVTLARAGSDDRFGETRTGHVRSFVKGDTCRELQFDNNRGAYVGGSLVPCEVEARREPPAPLQGERLNSIRNAFTPR